MESNLMACKPEWADSTKPRPIISKTKSRKVRKMLEDAKYHPTKYSIDDLMHNIAVFCGVSFNE